MTSVPVRCACGKLEGVVDEFSPKTGKRVVCYCDDCQLFQHYLGHADRVLDAHGGTDIVQFSPAMLRITAGKEHLACMRLRPGGTARWYAACCRTPIGNTLATAALPFVGLITACLDPAAGDRTLDDVLGPVRAGLQGRFARGNRDEIDAHNTAPISMMWGFMGRAIGRRLRGDHKRTPFFDAKTGALVVEPIQLDKAALAELRRRQQA